MGLLGSLPMLLLLIWSLWLPHLSAQSPARALDKLLQDYAYRAFPFRRRTGIVYDGVVPANLTGISISAMRLRSGSLRTKGVQMYKEFMIPKGVTETPYVERLVLVYQNLGNWSLMYYPLPGYTYLAPVLGLLAYDATNLTATNLPELDIMASSGPIMIKFPNVAQSSSEAKCIWFNLQGLVNFTSVISGNMCSTMQQGHFSIAVESTAPSPEPVPPPATPPGGAPRPNGAGKKKSNTSRTWIIIGSVLGGLVLLSLLGLMALWVRKYRRKRKMQQMERAADVGEALRMTPVGNTKAPAAMVTRTQPVLENEYVP